jgi:hypothetical protein
VAEVVGHETTDKSVWRLRIGGLGDGRWLGGPFTISVNPLQGYVPTAGGTTPVWISLATLNTDLGSPGIGAGTVLTFQGVGDVCFNGQGSNTSCALGLHPEVGVASIVNPFIGGFGATNGLPITNSSFIFPAGGTAIDTTGNGGDILNDFVVTSALSANITVPTGANFLLFTFNDSFYPDNADPNHDLGVTVTFVSNPVVPEPATYGMLLSGLGGLALLKRFRSRRS